jgi:hypothetical protein
MKPRYARRRVLQFAVFIDKLLQLNAVDARHG